MAGRRGVCARRRRPQNSVIGFMHLDLPLAPASSAWATSTTTAGSVLEVPESVPEPIPVELLGAGARAMHVVEVASRNLVQGALFGGVFGLISGGWSTKSFGGAWKEARANGRSWGAISAVYAGVQAASLAIRRKDDRINSVVGACGSGATFSAAQGPRAALQGCVSFAAISYLIEALTTPKEEDEQIDNKNSNSNKNSDDPAVILKK